MKTTVNNSAKVVVLPAIKGLFKKGETVSGNGWGNVDLKFRSTKIDKLEAAGYKRIAFKAEGDLRVGDRYEIACYENPTTGDRVYMQCAHGGPRFNKRGEETGVSAFGNMDFYRGEYYAERIGKKLGLEAEAEAPKQEEAPKADNAKQQKEAKKGAKKSAVKKDTKAPKQEEAPKTSAPKASAHKVGDVHTNGKWVWTEYKEGKFDWRAIKKTA